MLKLAFLTAASILALSGSVMAADLAAPPAAAPIAPAAASTWDGPYIGVFGGYGWGTANVDATAFNAGTPSYSVSGFLLGVQGGYNFHLSDAIVAGVSADIAWDNGSGSATIGNASVSSQFNWTGSITGRVGYDAGSFVPYVLAGVAFLNNTATVTDGPTGTGGATHTGYTVGAGVEFLLADNLSADIEYRYSNYGSQNYTSATFPGASIPASLSDNQIRIGLNYHF